METIKNYLDAMFTNMPDTPQVRKAKDELLQMMEDKYRELKEQGVSENTAIGTVISEFGNLDELADELNLKSEVESKRMEETEHPRRFVSMDEIKDFLLAKRRSAVLVGLGVFFCIISVCGPIISDMYEGGEWNEAVGVGFMFVLIALAVGFFVYNGITMNRWDYLKKEPCRIDKGTVDYVKEKSRGFVTTHALCVTVGVVLCVICWLPAAFMDNFRGMDNLGGALLFVLVALGVFLIIYANKISGSFDMILEINDEGTMGGRYSDEDVRYTNKTVRTIMEVYWPTVTCVYLIVSFLTFRWGITWIIWPVAGVAHKIIQIIFAEEK